MNKLTLLCLMLLASWVAAAPAPLPRKPRPVNPADRFKSTKYEFSWGGQKGTYTFFKDGSFDCYLGPNRYYGSWSYDPRTGKIWTNETNNGQFWTVFVYHTELPKDITKFSCYVYKYEPQTCEESKCVLCEFHTPKPVK